jgi:hypothetical protein
LDGSSIVDRASELRFNAAMNDEQVIVALKALTNLLLEVAKMNCDIADALWKVPTVSESEKESLDNRAKKVKAETLKMQILLKTLVR